MKRVSFNIAKAIMTDIEQRAKEYSSIYRTVPANRMGRLQGYVQGATDQRKIDIENAKAFAKKWLDEIIEIYLKDLKDEPFYSQALEHIYAKLEKAMEERL